MNDKERSEIAKMVTANILFVFSKLNEHPELFKQYAQTINLLSKCYISDQANAVILAAIDGDIVIVSVNASEIILDPDYNSGINIIGGDFVFKDNLEEVALSYDMKIGKVIKSPMDDLIQYHLDEAK